MNIFETRKKRLRQLIDERFSGVIKRCAEAVGINPPQVYRWFSEASKDSRRMEWESARAIEEKLSLPQGWLDIDPDEVEEESHARSTHLLPTQEEIKKAFVSTFNALCESLNIEKALALSWLHKEIMPQVDLSRLFIELTESAQQAVNVVEEERAMADQAAEKWLVKGRHRKRERTRDKR